MHYVTRNFLALAADHVRSEGVYHIAKKKIQSKDGPVQVRQTPKGPLHLCLPSLKTQLGLHPSTWRASWCLGYSRGVHCRCFDHTCHTLKTPC